MKSYADLKAAAAARRTRRRGHGSSLPVSEKSVKKVNRERKAETFARAYGGAERTAWMKRQSCCITGQSPCDVVHIKTGGVSRKADAQFTVPMIREKHRELHRVGIIGFQAYYGISLETVAAEYEKVWQADRAAGGKPA